MRSRAVDVSVKAAVFCASQLFVEIYRAETPIYLPVHVVLHADVLWDKPDTCNVRTNNRVSVVRVSYFLIASLKRKLNYLGAISTYFCSKQRTIDAKNGYQYCFACTCTHVSSQYSNSCPHDCVDDVTVFLASLVQIVSNVFPSKSDTRTCQNYLSTKSS